MIEFNRDVMEWFINSLREDLGAYVRAEEKEPGILEINADLPHEATFFLRANADVNEVRIESITSLLIEVILNNSMKIHFFHYNGESCPEPWVKLGDFSIHQEQVRSIGFLGKVKLEFFLYEGYAYIHL